MLSDVWELRELELSDKQISDISALSGLTNSTELYLTDNPIEDYLPVEFVEQNGGNLYK